MDASRGSNLHPKKLYIGGDEIATKHPAAKPHSTVSSLVILVFVLFFWGELAFSFIHHGDYNHLAKLARGR